MTKIKEDNELNNPVKEKTARKEGTRVSLIFILLILFLLAILLIFIYVMPHESTPATPPKTNQTNP